MLTNETLYTIDNKKSLVNLVINAILDGIKTHKYKSGDRLPPEPVFMKSFDVSRGTVREAMKVLSALGIITIKQGEGTYISDASAVPLYTTVAYSLLLSEANIGDILDFRVQIDHLSVFAASMRCTDQYIKCLENMVVDMRNLFNDGDYDSIAERDLEFHLEVVNSTRNPFIVNLLAPIYRFFGSEFIHKSNNKMNFEEVEKSHNEIIKCLKTKDFEEFIESQVDHREVLFSYFGKEDQIKVERRIK